MSQTRKPVTKGKELVDTLARIADSDEIKELEIRRLKRDANALMGLGPVPAHIVLGGIAALQGKADEVERHHRIAVDVSGNSAEALLNGASSLNRVGRVNDALQALLQAHETAPDDPYVLEAAILQAIGSAHFRKARELNERWSRLNPDKAGKDGKGMRMAAEAVDRGVFTEEGAQGIVKLAHQVRNRAKVRTAGGSLLALQGEPDNFLYEMSVRTSSQGAVELNEAFADEIVSNEDLMADPGMKLTLVFVGTRADGRNTR